MFCLLCGFLDFVTVFNQSYNCQSSHYLGKNRVFRPSLIFLCYNSLYFSYGYNSQDYLDDRVGMNTSPSVGEMKIKGLKMHLVDGPTKGLNQASCFLTKPMMGPILLQVCFSYTSPTSSRDISFYFNHMLKSNSRNSELGVYIFFESSSFQKNETQVA